MSLGILLIFLGAGDWLPAFGVCEIGKRGLLIIDLMGDLRACDLLTGPLPLPALLVRWARGRLTSSFVFGVFD